jgi:hypothetical protein
MLRCEKCKRPFADEAPAYEVRFGFVYIGDASGRTCTRFEEDGETELYHGFCISLPERQNDWPCSGK